MDIKNCQIIMVILLRPMTAYFQTEGTFAGRIAGCVGHGPDGGCYVIAGLSDKTKV